MHFACIKRKYSTTSNQISDDHYGEVEKSGERGEKDGVRGRERRKRVREIRRERWKGEKRGARGSEGTGKEG